MKGTRSGRGGETDRTRLAATIADATAMAVPRASPGGGSGGDTRVIEQLLTPTQQLAEVNGAIGDGDGDDEDDDGGSDHSSCDAGTKESGVTAAATLAGQGEKAPRVKEPPECRVQPR
jgi:hypothetical protein